MNAASAHLIPMRIALGEPEFTQLLTWPFAAEPFYEGQVLRLLQHDIPLRVLFGFGVVWAYRNREGKTVGLGTLDVCREYEQFATGKFHTYIPLLAVHPDFRGLGYGRRIVEHLVKEAAQVAAGTSDVSDRLFLDVYSANEAAISLYLKCGFEVLNPTVPILDSDENNQPYVVMARRVADFRLPS